MSRHKHPLAPKTNGRPKNGIYSFLRTSAVPPDKMHIARMVDASVAEIIADLGGAASLSAQQMVIIRQIRQSMIYSALIEEKLAGDGIFTTNAEGRLDVASALHPVWLAVSNNIVRYAEKLGLNRKRSPLDLKGYLKEKGREATS